MAYVDKLIGHDEQILYVARQHIFVLISHVVTELLVIAVLVAAGVVSNTAFQRSPVPDWLGSVSASTLILLVCTGLSLFVLLSGLLDYWRWNTEQYIITDRRVLQLRGIFNKSVIDSSLEKINDIELRQNILGRIFNFGTIAILTASGDDGINVMDRIEAPLDFKRIMLEAKNMHDHAYGYLPPRAAHAQNRRTANTSAEIQNMLQDLATLRDRGILSSDEFEAKKRELLNRI